MEERIIRLPELITYHQINEVWEESIACFCTKSDMKNISKIPPVLADMFSFIVVEEGMAHYILNYKEYNGKFPILGYPLLDGRQSAPV